MDRDEPMDGITVTVAPDDEFIADAPLLVWVVNTNGMTLARGTNARWSVKMTNDVNGPMLAISIEAQATQ